MNDQSDSVSTAVSRSRRVFLSSVGVGLASLSTFTTVGRLSRGESRTADKSDEATRPSEPVNTKLGFSSTAVTTRETVIMTCEWEITTRIAAGGFHSLMAVVQSATIDSPEPITEPFPPDRRWTYDTAGADIPIRGAIYQWSAADRWVTPGTYRIEALIDPYHSGEVTALVGPSGGEYFDWTRETISVDW